MIRLQKCSAWIALVRLAEAVKENSIMANVKKKVTKYKKAKIKKYKATTADRGKKPVPPKTKTAKAIGKIGKTKAVKKLCSQKRKPTSCLKMNKTNKRAF